MNSFNADETRIYATAESADIATEGYPQCTTSDTDWEEKE